MKTLLIYPPGYQLLDENNGYYRNLPLGLAYLSSYLKSKNKDCRILDLNMKMFKSMQKTNKLLWRTDNRFFWERKDFFEKKVLPLIDMEKWADYILSFKYDIIGFHMSYSSEHFSVAIAKIIKEKNKKIKIIFGGPNCFHENAKNYSSVADAIVIGEGEITLNELIENNFKLCKGAYVNGVWGGDREIIKDLDSLPFPDFDDVIEDYKPLWGKDYGWISVSWVRGCNGACHFCYDRKYWRGARMRSAKNIVSEIEFQMKKYKVCNFNRGDSTLTISVKILNEICDLIIKKKININWYTQARPDNYLTPALLKKMRKAGCRGLSYGVESGSQKILNSLGKGYLIKNVEKVIKNTHDAGISCFISLMVNEPSENLFDYLKTIIFLIKNRKYIEYYSVSAAGLIPTSDWVREPNKYGFNITKTIEKDGYYYYDKPNQKYGELKRRFLEKIKPYLKTQYDYINSDEIDKNETKNSDFSSNTCL